MWQITGASIPGSDHTMPGKPGWKNNQDAIFTSNDGRITIGIVADGCGSGKCSEVGSQIGVRLLGELLMENILRSPLNFGRIRMNLLGQISVLANSMGVSLSTIVGEYFLFSIVGFVITPKVTTVFHCGDGMYSINGELTQIGPFANNAPPYLAYGILDESSPGFQVHLFETDSIASIAVGTDGVDYMSDFKNQLAIWTATDVVFVNPDVLRRRISLMNLERIQNGILIPGPLKDDTSLVISRRQI